MSTATTPAIEKKQIPLAALRFAADMEVGDNGAEAKTVPVTINARNSKPVEHWWFGKIAHDLEGMQPSKSHIPLDYCHRDSEIIGFANKFDISSGNLIASGALTPFKADDRAAEIIAKAKAGVPYEASIYFDPDALVLESVPEGMTAQVNGYEFQGPGVIARQWMLRGLAICPHGQDRETSVEFSARKDAPQVAVKFTAATAPPATSEVEAPEAASEVEGNTSESAVEGDTPVEAAPAAEGESAATPATSVDAGDALSQFRAEGKRFLTEFGDKGAKWFAEGKSFEESQVLFRAELATENEALRKELEQTKAMLTAARGEPSPVSFTAADDEPVTKPQPSPNQKAALGDNLAKFAAGIKITRGGAKARK